MTTSRHWAGERGRALAHALATYQVTTTTAGPRTVYRASFDFGFELPSPDCAVVIDPTAARFGGAFGTLDLAVPAAAISAAVPPVVTLDGPREVRRVAFTSAKSYAGTAVQLFRLDQEQRSSKETVSAAVGPGNAASGFGGFSDVRFAVAVAQGGPAKSEIASITVRGEPTGARLGIAAPSDPASVSFFWPTPAAAGTTVEAGAAFGDVLQTYLTAHAGDPSPSVRLVIQSDQPCQFALTAFATGAAFALDAFAVSALVAADVVDAEALARRIESAAEPASAHLRAALGPAPLVEGLNAVIGGPSLYDAERFAGIALGPQTQAALVVGDVPRLNRLLLQDAYPGLIAAPGEKRVLRFGDEAAAEPSVVVDVPAGAVVTKATLATQESFAPDRPATGAAASGGDADGRSGIRVSAGETVAVAVAVETAVAATGVALPLLALVAATAATIEIQDDTRGAPSGRRLAGGLVELQALGRPVSAGVFFAATVVPAGTAWIVIRAATGSAVLLASAAAGATLRVVRSGNGAPPTEVALEGLAPRFEFFSRAGAALERPATELRAGPLALVPVRNGDHATYELAGALDGGGRVELAFSSAVSGAITVYPPHVEFDLADA